MEQFVIVSVEKAHKAKNHWLHHSHHHSTTYPKNQIHVAPPHTAPPANAHTHRGVWQIVTTRKKLTYCMTHQVEKFSLRQNVSQTLLR